MQLFAVLV